MKTEPDIWKRKKSERIADCRVFTVRRDISTRESDGAEVSFFVIENPDWVNVIALTEKRQVVLIEQFRHGAGEVALEIPGGMVDENEAPETAARRELLEETGFSSKDFVCLGKSRPNPALQNNWIHHFLARDCVKTGETNFDENESITTKLAALGEIEQFIESGKITHSLDLAAFYKFQLLQSRRKNPR